VPSGQQHPLGTRNLRCESGNASTLPPTGRRSFVA
jgi:hypothetical protein